MTQIQYVFCHGLNGCGEYDKQYKKSPYWGSPHGDMMEHLRMLGYECHAASVAPNDSAWDRACELYAQLAGTRTDYGRMHAETYKHERYGPDFTGRPLIREWNDDTKIVLLGHSFGGVTVRLLAELLKNGDETERDNTHPLDVSPLFLGGMGNRVAAVVTLAAPSNGTTAYDMNFDPDFDSKHANVGFIYEVLAKITSLSTGQVNKDRIPEDRADHDMEIDNAMSINKHIHIDPDTYYFSVACCSTVEQPDGICVPDKKKTDGLFVRTSTLMGRYKGKTPSGCIIDESWRANDGLVNVKSAHAPFGDPKKNYDPEDVKPGIWNILPDYEGDHGSLQGGFMLKSDPTLFYEELMVILERTLA